MSPKKKFSALHQQQQQLHQQQQLSHSYSAPNFDPESSNSNLTSAGFINVGPGFSPFATPLKRDDQSYDWVR
jgi:hypothetical protein